MRHTKLNLLTSPGFVIGISLLFLNDFYLKAELHNWFTGKLSDFAGLFAFSLFFLSFSKKAQKPIVFIIGLLFILWKSPISGSFIGLWNTYAPFTIARVVDHTDLFALSVLPLACMYAKKAYVLSSLKISKVLALGIAVFAFTATSRVDDQVNEFIPLDKSYILPYGIDTVRAKFEALTSAEYLEDLTNENNQTFGIITFQVESCTGLFEYSFTFLENENNETELYLSDVLYTCEDEYFTADQLIVFFETKVIDEIN
ncbi:hypothetical protein ACFQZJ_01940 [Maribacter chungangensis]|uniref:Uncharacterized protein n=1 Tax=Maribacter chungangensis TaxID=1069117 RepID=A0ABW3B025_9FLAO